MKLTPTFPPEIKPARPGVYMVAANKEDIDGETPADPGYAKFDGEIWGCRYIRLLDAHEMPMDSFYADQSKYWRGLEGMVIQLR